MKETFTLEASGLAKWFVEDRTVLDVPDLKVEGSRLCFLGENGSGKTTMLSVVAGLVRPSKGTLRLNGVEPYKSRDQTLESTSFIFEKPKLSYRMKVREFAEFLSEHQEDLAENFEHIVEALHVDEFYEKRLFELSSGQEQLVYLLAALGRKSRLIVLDEPFTHIDLSRVGNIISYMREMGRDLVFSTHVPDEAEALADYIVILKGGKPAWKGTLSELYDSDVYEVYLREGTALDTECLFRYGNTVLVQSEKQALLRLLGEDKILGFRKAGVKRVYAKPS